MLFVHLPIDIISTSISSRIKSAAIAAVKPLTKVASTGVPVLGQTCENTLKKNKKTIKSFNINNKISLLLWIAIRSNVKKWQRCLIFLVDFLKN